MVNAATINKVSIWKVLDDVMDPEVPVLSIIGLGIVRDIECTTAGGEIFVRCIITPTYTGCPAMDVIGINIRMALLAMGIKNIEIKTVLSPAWTTEWMSEKGKQKLKEYGIAPPNPQHTVCTSDAFQKEEAVQCPHCNSYHTTMISRFGSTACKALYKCEDCKEPFDYFKCH